MSDLVVFAVPYANRAQGGAMRRNEAQAMVERGLSLPGLTCPACAAAVSFRREHARARGHFYHVAEPARGGSGCALESEIHAVFKTAVAAEITQNGLDTGAIRGWRGPREFWRGMVAIEQITHDRMFRIDVGFSTFERPRIAIEVVNLGRLSSEKRDALHREGWTVLTVQPRNMTPEERVDFWDAEDRVAFARTVLARLGYYHVRLQGSHRASLPDQAVSEADFICAPAPDPEAKERERKKQEDLMRARALRIWHSQPATYPNPFRAYAVTDLVGSTNPVGK